MNTKITALERRRGVTLVFIAIVLFVLLGFIGLMLDTSYVYLSAHQLQNAADAAALAGAADVAQSTSAAITAAVAAAADNTVSGTSLRLDAPRDVQIGNYVLATETFTPNLTPYNAVQVTARRTARSPGGPIHLIFGPMFGITTSNVSRQATAMFRGTFDAGIVALDPSLTSSFGANGNSALDVAGGGIQVNSSDGAAVSVQGGATTIQATELRVQGGVSAGGATLPSQIDYGAPPVADPLANLPAPTEGTDQGTVNVTDGSIAGPVPGYYSGGISATDGTVNLAPGTYVLGPPGLNISGTASLSGTGVTIYLTTGNSPGSYGTLNLGGTGAINLSAPTTGTYTNILVFQDRSTPYSAGSDTIAATPTTTIAGVVYTPSVNFTGSGNSTSFTSQIIADTVSFSPNSSLTVQYNPNNDAPNGFPVTLNEVFLVK
jgi:Flp pilus assembly protein TadG